MLYRKGAKYQKTAAALSISACRIRLFHGGLLFPQQRLRLINGSIGHILWIPDEGTHIVARQKITTFLWFDREAEEAARFYVSLFPDSRIDRLVPGPDGQTLTVEFRLSGVEFIALNGGPHFQFNEAVSLSVDCADQAEIDDLWTRLSAGGSTSQCGWLKDRYGLSWQIVPSILPELMADPGRAPAVFQAMMQMTKLDIAGLQAAGRGADSSN